MKNLPIGIQSLPILMKNNCVYVDKTQLVHQMVTTGTAYFLSRPRRFGKSLLVSTLKELFLGNKDLFKGLWIENHWDWTKKHPVLHFSFDSMSYRAMGLDGALLYSLKNWAEHYGIELMEKDYKSQFQELIIKLNAKHGSVVIVIDEYDKPLIDFLEKDQLPQAKINQAIMKEFYSVLKSAGEQVRFLFITGISKFSKVSIFSDLNHLTDLTLYDDYATLTGYTHQELDFYFADYIHATAKKMAVSREQLLDKMQIWYNGFSWDGKTKVYNPFGVLNFLAKKQFDNYWFATGTPTFLLNQMKRVVLYNVEDTHTNLFELEKYDIENLDLIVLLFQTGYLTLKAKDLWTGDIVLDYPNKEVRESMYRFLMSDIAPNQARGDSGLTVQALMKAFKEANLKAVHDILNGLFSDLPVEVYQKKSEGLYHGLIHVTFKFLGMYILSEVHSSRGHADSVVETDTDVFIFEYKFNKTAEEALAQIKSKQYAGKYQASGKRITGIGVNFNEDNKEIDGWLEENLNE